ncbi:MAG TPA: XRE family transcriptional regulator [Thermoanaerobaculia bacterium]|nr:XRE family transcriptional regulator [Thermoanaerobaculia bacterium]
MARKFSELTSKMSPERRARVEARTQEMLAEMPLQELRKAMEMSQERLSELLGWTQPSISKVEHQTDMFVSTLRSYIEALGGELEIRAKLPAGDVIIKRFDEIQDHPDAQHQEPTRRRAKAGA